MSNQPLCKDYSAISDLRATDPAAITRAWQARTTRPTTRGDSRLMIVAADHPARGALAVGSRPTAMNSRTDLLDRLQAALADPGVDGVLATADILDDLLLLGALEDKVVFSSMNRGGLAGAQFELDDRMTAATAAATAAARTNGGKMLCRIDLDDPGTASTLEACARAIDELASYGLIAMVEPFMSTRVDGKIHNDLSPDAVIKSIHICQGLGSTSAYTWLKLPVVDEMDRVMESTTLPTLLLGGDPADPDEAFAGWQKALGLPSVRGLIVGRTLLYPADDDVSSAVATAVSMVRTWASAGGTNRPKGGGTTGKERECTASSTSPRTAPLPRTRSTSPQSQPAGPRRA
jgi:DhnA family fructose-bisphosphate aldolase class Ia